MLIAYIIAITQRCCWWRHRQYTICWWRNDVIAIMTSRRTHRQTDRQTESS